MKIVFLDIDGVLLPFKDLWRTRNHRYLSPAAVNYLNAILEASGAQLVISSTWRLDPLCRTYLDRAGVKPVYHEAWHTPWDASFNHNNHLRGDEIDLWMQRNGKPDRYIIIDDDSDMRPEQIPFFVHPKGVDGLQPDHVIAAIALLCPERSTRIDLPSLTESIP